MILDAETERKLRELLDGYFPTGLRDFDELIAAISDIITAAVKKERHHGRLDAAEWLGNQPTDGARVHANKIVMWAANCAAIEAREDG